VDCLQVFFESGDNKDYPEFTADPAYAIINGKVISTAATRSDSRMEASPRKTTMTQTLRNFIKQWLPHILWLCFIFWMSTGSFSSENTFSAVRAILQFLLPNLSAREAILIHAMTRKAAHVFEYFILGLLLFRAFHVPGAGWK
jgi:hypothetical protein